MSEAVLSEPFLARAAGWQAMKEARSLLAAGKVFHSDWTPPMLKGEVQGGTVRYRAGLRIQSATHIDNLCTCRQSREWGTLCAHSVAVGLHHLNPGKGEAPVAAVERGGSKPAAGELSLNPDRPRRWRAAGGEENDEPLSVHVILPPNPAEAVARGKVMLVLEGEWDGKRRPLNSLPADRLFAVQPGDESLLDEIERLSGGATPGMVMLSGGDFARVLERLIDHPRITAGKSKPITVSSQSASSRVRARLQSSGEIELRLESGLEGALVHGETAIWTLAGRTFQRMGLPACLHPLVRGPMRLERPEVPTFLMRDWPRLRQECELDADFTPEDFVLEPLAPRFRLELEGGLAQLRAKLSALYGERTFPLGGRAASEAHWIPAADSQIAYSTRDLAAEREALARLIRAGFSEPDGEGRLHLKGQDSVLRFLAMEYPRCQREWTVTLEERLERSTRDKVERIEPEFRVTGSG
ncbi:MAG TPA: SNF2 helicase associated domain-containing protein, partial [Methylomirabilota bacterium]|nr:SNF2 helicase associated domain-containing protein [Methylomirabilota bacterium]